MKVQFQKVTARRVYRFTDPATGKRRQRSKVFVHTVNPFNKNEDGSIRSYAEVRLRVNAEANKWLEDQAP